MKKLTSIMLILILVGCATQAQRISNQKVELYKQAEQQLDSCMRSIINDEDLVYYSKNIRTFSPNAPERFSLLKKESLLSSQEKAIFSSANAKYFLCRDEFRSNVTKADPRLGYAVSTFNLDFEKNSDALMLDKLTIAKFNENADALFYKFRGEMASISAKIDSELTVAHNQEIAYRAALLDEALKREADYQRQREIIYQQSLLSNKPVFTNCSRLGHVINCVSK